MTEPTVEALIKSWIEWAFVPAKRPYRRSSYSLKHEVEETWRDWYIPERDFIRGMADAGFKATKDGHRFYVADSPSRKTYHRELQQLPSGTVPHPLHRLDPTTEFNKLPSAEQQRLLAWIGEHLRPTKKRTLPAYLLCDRCCGTSSDGRYAAFCGAMLAAGYQPVNPAAYRWEFCAAAK